MRPGRPGNMTFLRSNPKGLAWASSSVAGFERALERHGMHGVCLERSNLVVFASKVLARLGLLRQLRILRRTTYLAALMGRLERRLFPVCYFNRTIVYCYDCWAPEYEWWEAFFRRHRFSLVLFSARQSADYFRDRLPGMESVWLPEATDPARFKPAKPLVDRTIDVLELGRRWEAYHEQIAPRLAAENRIHRYEASPGSVVFPDPAGLVAGLANTRVSVLFPSSLTHPARSGNVETVTHKYFESMASRCLPLGKCPRELLDLFGYDPVVEVDLSDPGAQITGVLAAIGDYQQLVDRNYDAVMELGTWDARVPELLSACERALMSGDGRAQRPAAA